jgi:SAM-dependent methyltransferase
MRVSERVSPESAKSAEIWWTGERLIAGVEGDRAIQALHRYAVACALVPGQTVLDIASGDGYGAHLLAQYASHVIGVDVSSRAVQYARASYSRANLDFRVGDCAEIPLDSDSVDTVVSFATLEHLDLQHEMLREIRRILRPGGLLVISTSRRQDRPHNAPSQDPFHVKELSEDEFRGLLGRFFQNHSVYHQYSTGVSLLVPADGPESHTLTITRGNYSAIGHSRDSDVPLQLIGLASDGALPELPCSLFHGEGVRDDKDLRIALLEERERERIVRQREDESLLSRREKELCERHAQESRRDCDCQQIRQSWSWRITAPLRATMDLARRLILPRK